MIAKIAVFGGTDMRLETEINATIQGIDITFNEYGSETTISLFRTVLGEGVLRFVGPNSERTVVLTAEQYLDFINYVYLPANVAEWHSVPWAFEAETWWRVMIHDGDKSHNMRGSEEQEGYAHFKKWLELWLARFDIELGNIIYKPIEVIYEDAVHLRTLPVVGYAYLTYKERSIYDGLVEDGIVDDAAPQVDLVRDPTNAHDENAILVLYKGTKLGYLPKNNNKILARLMDGGVKLQAEVNPDIDDEKVWVSIALAK